MSEEMKLLTALCEALGFTVNTNLDYKERKEHEQDARRINRPDYIGDRRLMGSGGAMSMILDIDDDGMYTSRLINPITSHTLIKD